MMESDRERGNEDSLSGRDGFFWATIALSLFTAVSATLVAARTTWSFSNRHFDLPGIVDAMWEFGSYVVNTREFAVAYVVLPLVWLGTVLWWWAKRSSHRSWAQWLLFAALGIASIVGMAGWLATATDQAAWAFGVAGVPDVITTFGIESADVREPVTAVALAFLAAAAAANLILMFLATSRSASTTGS